ncbi:MAG: ABC transporter permease [Nocardioides sp.]|uniref:ABC transporter permease n=1 Tax=Nocardioides sp. TaxID=35761 RepID=UPI0039E5B108
MSSGIAVVRRRARTRTPAGQMSRLLRSTVSSRTGLIGLILVVLIVAIAFLGPLVRPDDPTAIVGTPFAGPSGSHLLGTDNLGRDTLSRFLVGGRTILLLSFCATLAGVVLGTAFGLIAGYLRGWVGQVIMRVLDIVLSFPPLLLALLFMSVVGPKWWILLICVAATHVPPVARVVESAVLALVSRGFVEYAEMIGVSRRRIMSRDLLVNITAPVMVQMGIRTAYSIGFIGALAYLGFGAQPPAADWGTMIQENQINLISAPLPVVAPILALALVSIGVNFLSDAFGRAAGIDLGKDA